MMNFVCKEYDKYLTEFSEKNAIWFVTLSNGETVYQDDDRPNIEPSSAWLRLAQTSRGTTSANPSLVSCFQMKLDIRM